MRALSIEMLLDLVTQTRPVYRAALREQAGCLRPSPLW